ncbi:MAG: hypothetical protein QNL33_13025 [Akkermansiaceae bacterium]
MMKFLKILVSKALVGGGFVALILPCVAAPLITNGDFAIGIDEDLVSNSSYPAGESPAFVIDGDTATKYLNFGRVNSGFIVTPVGGGSTVQSFTLTTANDSEERDPAQIEIYGTNDVITSADNSAGDLETWTRISAVELTLPFDRSVTTLPINVVNSGAFTSYKVLFSKLKGPDNGLPTPNSMQVAEMQMWEQSDGAGLAILTIGAPILAVHEASLQSSSPLAESVASLFDGDTATKYLNFGRDNSGFIVTPSSGPSVVTSFMVSTANDFEARDPATWEFFGTNDVISSEPDSDGKNENWVSIASGGMNLPVDRFTAGPEVSFTNTALYTSYKWLVRSVRDPLADGVDSTQYSEFQLFSDGGSGQIRIMSISKDPVTNEVQIEWEAPANGLYTLQSSIDLDDWSGVVASDLTFEDDSSYIFESADPKSFFRIIPTPTF